MFFPWCGPNYLSALRHTSDLCASSTICLKLHSHTTLFNAHSCKVLYSGPDICHKPKLFFFNTTADAGVLIQAVFVCFVFFVSEVGAILCRGSNYSNKLTTKLTVKSSLTPCLLYISSSLPPNFLFLHPSCLFCPSRRVLRAATLCFVSATAQSVGVERDSSCPNILETSTPSTTSSPLRYIDWNTILHTNT